MESLEQACDHFVHANKAKKESGKLTKGMNDTKKFIISEMNQRNLPFYQNKDGEYLVLKKKIKTPRFLDIFKEVYDQYQISKNRMVDQNEAEELLEKFKDKRKSSKESNDLGFLYDLDVSAIQPPSQNGIPKRKRTQ